MRIEIDENGVARREKGLIEKQLDALRRLTPSDDYQPSKQELDEIVKRCNEARIKRQKNNQKITWN